MRVIQRISTNLKIRWYPLGTSAGNHEPIPRLRWPPGLGARNTRLSACPSTTRPARPAAPRTPLRAPRQRASFAALYGALRGQPKANESQRPRKETRQITQRSSAEPKEAEEAPRGEQQTGNEPPNHPTVQPSNRPTAEERTSEGPQTPTGDAAQTKTAP